MFCKKNNPGWNKIINSWVDNKSISISIYIALSIPGVLHLIKSYIKVFDHSWFINWCSRFYVVLFVNVFSSKYFYNIFYTLQNNCQVCTGFCCSHSLQSFWGFDLVYVEIKGIYNDIRFIKCTFISSSPSFISDDEIRSENEELCSF